MGMITHFSKIQLDFVNENEGGERGTYRISVTQGDGRGGEEDGEERQREREGGIPHLSL